MSWSRAALIEKLKSIKSLGWIPSRRPVKQAGGVGNTLEDLLGIEENNIPLANAGIWELKAQRRGTSSLITLFHFEPEPRDVKVVVNVLLPKYGWPHETRRGEMSFRVTMRGDRYTDRGFRIIVNRDEERVYVSFNYRHVSRKHEEWLRHVAERAGLGEIDPQPYWTFEALQRKCREKLRNLVYVLADTRRTSRGEEFYYNEAWLLEGFSFERFINGIESGLVLIDFDARTGHNHGTKFRIRNDLRTWAALYSFVQRIM